MQHNEEDDTYKLLWHHDYKISREIQFMEWYEPGSYIIVPLTSGGLLSAPTNPSNIQDWSKISIDKRFNYCDFDTTITDIYWKFDLDMNRRLDENELNHMGYMSDIDFLE